MLFTNRFNLPQYIVDWLKNDEYDHIADPLTFSATTLMKPSRVYWLTRRYADRLQMDVSELIASRTGSAIHDSIEKVVTPGVSKEIRSFRQIEVDGVTYTVSGKYDLLVNENGKYYLRDIKTTSVWAYIFGGKDEDYQSQLSVYRWILQEQCQIEDVAYIDFFFTDWQSQKAKTEEGYPPNRIHAGYKIPLMSLQETERFVARRLKEFGAFRDVADDDLPFCTAEELWASNDTFAVMKPGAKRATRVLESREEAIKYIRDNGLASATIESRPGKVKRCKYCAAAPFCGQYKQLQKDGMIDYF